jgi:DNA (cytosine-5)-methyltransferase 1
VSSFTPGSGRPDDGAAHTPSRPLLLDLFCGAGGAAVGYDRAGFEVFGIDVEPQANYPYTFHQHDALHVLRHLIAGSWEGIDAYDAIHASPPCQAYTTMNNRHGSASPPLIAEVRDLLNATGLPWVIENVPGALAEMLSPVELTGEMFGLRVHRPRLFETSFPIMVPPRPARQADPVAVYGKNDQRRLWTRKDGTELRAATLETGSEAMGIDWMTWDELREAIPPAYTEHVGSFLMQEVEARVAATDYDKLKALCYALFRSNIDWTHEAANCGDDECHGDCKYIRTVVETVREIDGGILR